MSPKAYTVNTIERNLHDCSMTLLCLHRGNCLQKTVQVNFCASFQGCLQATDLKNEFC